MNLLNLPWIHSRKRLIIGSFIDLLILIIILFIKSKYFIINQNIKISFLIFYFVCAILSYIFGRYLFRVSNSLLKSIKLYLFNSFKVYISITFPIMILIKNHNISLFLSNEIFNFYTLILFFILSSSLHIILISYLHRNSSKFKKWIFIGDANIILLNKNIDNKYYLNEIEKLDSVNDIYSIDFQKKQFEGIICSQSFDEEISFEFLRVNKLLLFTVKDWCQIYLQRFPPNILKSSDIFRMNKSLNERTMEMRLKRLADVFLSTILIVLLSPVLIIFAVLIYLEDRGPIFYSQIRTGHNLNEFRIYKLRSMKVNAEKYGASWASANDKRISKVGKFIRATRIDELPQLWSVLIGEMSLIGPRPERPEFDSFLSKKISFYNSRYSIKPGLSGWAQVNYPYGGSDEDSENKLSFDLYYIENFSFFLDLLIFFKTIRLILNAKGSEQGAAV